MRSKFGQEEKEHASSYQRRWVAAEPACWPKRDRTFSATDLRSHGAAEQQEQIAKLLSIAQDTKSQSMVRSALALRNAVRLHRVRLERQSHMRQFAFATPPPCPASRASRTRSQTWVGLMCLAAAAARLAQAPAVVHLRRLKPTTLCCRNGRHGSLWHNHAMALGWVSA